MKLGPRAREVFPERENVNMSALAKICMECNDESVFVEIGSELGRKSLMVALEEGYTIIYNKVLTGATEAFFDELSLQKHYADALKNALDNVSPGTIYTVHERRIILL